MSLWNMLFGANGGASRINSNDARTLIEEQDAALIDVRSPGEYGGGHLPGALNIPVDALMHRISEVPQDRPVVVYCRSGARSARAAGILRQHGRSAYDLGPMSAW
ncbi:MAG: rhodanese-like domain-containing protein [Myxococcales bacterium]|nr:rhodanese-like domain-containing protein [Myxococcales bacterium]MCB9706542.1 rhodanese-like domain-containing protein [Myxococcales bacterium]